MLNEEKSIHIIEFSKKNVNWKSWFKKLLLCGKQKKYKKLLVSIVSLTGVDMISTEVE